MAKIYQFKSNTTVTVTDLDVSKEYSPEDFKDKDLISRVLVSPLISPYVATLSDSDREYFRAVWKDMNYPTSGKLAFHTQIRKNLIPEFGIQHHTEFLSIHLQPYPDKPSPVNILDGLERLSKYSIDHFPQIPSSLLMTVYAAIATILEYPGCRLVRAELGGDLFCMSFQISNQDEQFCVDVFFNFVPFLLDYLAMKMVVEAAEGSISTKQPD